MPDKMFPAYIEPDSDKQTVCGQHEDILLKIERLITTLKIAGGIFAVLWGLGITVIGFSVNRAITLASAVTDIATGNQLQDQKILNYTETVDRLQTWRYDIDRRLIILEEHSKDRK